MDNTESFRECVKLNANGGLPRATPSVPVMPHSSAIRDKGKEIVGFITKLKLFLLNNRKQYINVKHLVPHSCAMSDFDRDQIDAEAEAIISKCNQLLNNLKREAVCTIHSEQRAIRIKRAVDAKKLSRLEILVLAQRDLKADRSFASASVSADDVDENGITANELQVQQGEPSLQTVADSDRRQFTANRVGVRRRRFNASPVSQHSPSCSIASASRDLLSECVENNANTENDGSVLNLTPDETLQLQAENDTLYAGLNHMVDEIRQIEGKVVEIGRLQDIFTEKILTQDADIQRIHSTAIQSTENIKSANDQIREAMKNKATARIYTMFILIVLSFTLMFLDWYNP